MALQEATENIPGKICMNIQCYVSFMGNEFTLLAKDMKLVRCIHGEITDFPGLIRSYNDEFQFWNSI